MQLAAIQTALCVSNLYAYAKERTGPLKQGVETVEGTIKSVVGPVYEKFHHVPVEFLKYLDHKVRTATIEYLCFALIASNDLSVCFYSFPCLICFTRVPFFVH